MTRITSTALLSLFLASCGPDREVPTVSVPATPAVCQALAPAFPVKYHGKTDSPDTIARIEQANARYAAACK